MTIRPIRRDELDVFARFSGADDLDQWFVDYLSELWQEGTSHPH